MDNMKPEGIKLLERFLEELRKQHADLQRLKKNHDFHIRDKNNQDMTENVESKLEALIKEFSDIVGNAG